MSRFYSLLLSTIALGIFGHKCSQLQSEVLECLEECQPALNMTRPGDHNYDKESVSYNRLIEASPIVIVHPLSVEQVQCIVRCHAEVVESGNFTERLNFTIRSGGHSYEGFSTNQNGVVLDMDLFKNLTFHESTITVQPGIRLGDYYQRLNDHNNWTAVGGTCPNVGLGGLVLGGGFGHLSRRYGLASDRVIGMEIVLANGSVVYADESHYSDLFWANRGGGGGNFGVVTSFDIRSVIGLGKVLNYYTSFSITETDWDYVAELFVLVQPWAIARSQDWGSVVFQLHPRKDELEVGLYGFYLGKERANLEAELQAFLNTPEMQALNHRNVKTTIEEDSYNTFMQQEEPNEERSWFKTTNNYIYEDHLMSISALRRLFQAAMQNSTYKPDFLQFHAYGNGCQVNALSSDATAFPYRSMAWHLQTFTTIPEKRADDYLDYLKSLFAVSAEVFSEATYIDYVDSWLGARYLSAYYGSNLDRLRAIKQLYDPFHVFDFPQAIR